MVIYNECIVNDFDMISIYFNNMLQFVIIKIKIKRVIWWYYSEKQKIFFLANIYNYYFVADC